MFYYCHMEMLTDKLLDCGVKRCIIYRYVYLFFFSLSHQNISIDQIGHNTISDDMEMLLDLIQKQFNNICSKNMRQLFLKVETKLTPLLAIMDTRKIKVSTDTMLKFSDILQVLNNPRINNREFYSMIIPMNIVLLDNYKIITKLMNMIMNVHLKSL